MRRFGALLVLFICVMLGAFVFMLFKTVQGRAPVAPRTYEVTIYGGDTPKVWKGVLASSFYNQGGSIGFTDPTTGRGTRVYGGPVVVHEEIKMEAQERK